MKKSKKPLSKKIGAELNQNKQKRIFMPYSATGDIQRDYWGIKKSVVPIDFAAVNGKRL